MLDRFLNIKQIAYTPKANSLTKAGFIGWLRNATGNQMNLVCQVGQVAHAIYPKCGGPTYAIVVDIALRSFPLQLCHGRPMVELAFVKFNHRTLQILLKKNWHKKVKLLSFKADRLYRPGSLPAPKAGQQNGSSGVLVHARLKRNPKSISQGIQALIQRPKFCIRRHEGGRQQHDVH